MLIDKRSAPNSSGWSFYAVDHLPTMGNIYRYDTIQEAIEKYKELPATEKSAIGASKDNMYELDLIHRCGDNIPCLVTDFMKVDSPVWQEKEILDVIDQLIVGLAVERQLDSDTFGEGFLSVCVDLERNKDDPLDKYFFDKQLFLKESESFTKKSSFLESIDEVFVCGKGWMEASDFFQYLEDCRPQAPGQGCTDVFVDRLNIKYKTEAGHTGYADLSPHEFKMLRDKTVREIEKSLKPELNNMISNAQAQVQNPGRNSEGKKPNMDLEL